MKKIILLLTLTFFLTGCSATYNIEIYNNQVKEDLEYVNTNSSTWDSEAQYGFTYRELVTTSHEYPYPAFNSAVVDEDDTIKLDGIEYYENNLISTNDRLGQSLSYHGFTLDDFSDSSIVKKCYKYFNIIEEGENIVLSTSYENKCFEEYKSLDSITINLKTNHKVVSSNADIVNGYHYTWNITELTKDDAAIMITLKKDEYIFNYENEFIKKIIYIAGITGIIVIISGGTYMYFKKKRTRVNEV